MSAITAQPVLLSAPSGDGLFRRVLRSRRVVIGGGILLVLVGLCVISLPWTLSEGAKVQTAQGLEPANKLFYNQQGAFAPRRPPGDPLALWFGADGLGRSVLGRCLLGGAISLGIGLAAAAISVVLGVGVGLVAGYRGGWIDATSMRMVDVLYGLPYILLVLLLKLALEPAFARALGWLFGSGVTPWNGAPKAANLVVLFVAIGSVSWLTMARVIRGQVLSLRAQPFVEAARAAGLTEWRIFMHHLLPNLVGPITVYATLIVPQAILQESFLSFLGVGIEKPMPTWGALASDGLRPALNTIRSYWWMLTFPCTLLAATLLSLNFLGDGLRDVFDPKREAAKV